MRDVVLCADTESLMHPELIGLEDIELNSIRWLHATSDAIQARSIAMSENIGEVWVMSTHDLDGINIAAAICKDAPATNVYLIANQTSGSELSRATSAGISGIMTTTAFSNRFAEILKTRSVCDSIAILDSDEMLSEGMDIQIKTDTNSNADTTDLHEPPEMIKSNGGDLYKDDMGDGTNRGSSNSALPIKGTDEKTLEKALKGNPAQRNGNAFVISFLGGSGGVGKSTITALSAYLAAKMGYRTVALDCDMQFGDLHQIMGSVPSLSIDDLLANPDEISLLNMKTADNTPALVKAPARLESSEILATYVDEIIGICASEFDLIFVNTGASWDECHAQLLEKSAVSVFLIDQRASSVHSCRHALDLCMRLGIASASFVYALNKCKRGALFSATDIANALQGAHVFEIRDGGAEVEEMLGAGMAKDLASSKNEICTSIDDMLADLLPMMPGRPGYGSHYDKMQVFRHSQRKRNRKKTDSDIASQKHNHIHQKSRI